MSAPSRPAEPDWTVLQAVLFVLSASAIFSLIFISGRFVGDLASPFQIMFLRYAGGFLTVSILAVSQGETWKSLQSIHRPSQAMRALAGGLGGAAIIFANANMPLVDASAISQMNAVFTMVLGYFLFHDRLRRLPLLGALACICGAVVVMLSRGAFRSFEPSYLFPAGVVFAGAFLLAIEHIFIKYLASRDRPLLTLAHANFFGMLVLLVPALLTWRSTGPVNLALLCLGPFAILAQYFNIQGHRAATVSVLAPIGYAGLIFAIVWGWLFFAEVPPLGAFVGAAIIILGGTALALSRR